MFIRQTRLSPRDVLEEDEERDFSSYRDHCAAVRSSVDLLGMYDIPLQLSSFL
jgi:hypothetical protein